MTPKEKAKELFEVFNKYSYMNWSPESGFDEHKGYVNTKIIALICVNQIICSNPHSNPFNTDVYSTMKYWEEVTSEIEKL